MFYCVECGNEYHKWQGKCSCGEWNTIKEMKEKIEDKKNGKTKLKGESKKVSNIKENHEKAKDRIFTNSKELNSVLGGGIVEGSVILLSGEPGIGKSTLSIQLADWIKDTKILYVSGEETELQVSDRAKRFGINNENLFLLSEQNLENIMETINTESPELIILDSISVINSSNISGNTGSVSQVKYIAEETVKYAKQNNVTVIIIGHVTKDGNLAGPKTLEHLVDTVLFFEGEKYDNLRILRGIKNRFGATNEIGLFRMEEDGLSDIENPGDEFISNDKKLYGSALSVTIEGNRPLIIELESLTIHSNFGYAKRTSSGIIGSKLDLIIAILTKYTDVGLGDYDVYTNIVRGLKVNEPGIDLGIAASIISSKKQISIPKNTIFVGELSLTGEIKSIIHLERRIKEVEKLGFKNIVIPDIDLKNKYQINIVKVGTITDLIKYIK